MSSTLDLDSWLVGFLDGRGSLMASVRRESKVTTALQHTVVKLPSALSLAAEAAEQLNQGKPFVMIAVHALDGRNHGPLVHLLLFRKGGFEYISGR